LRHTKNIFFHLTGPHSEGDFSINTDRRPVPAVGKRPFRFNSITEITTESAGKGCQTLLRSAVIAIVKLTIFAAPTLNMIFIQPIANHDAGRVL